MPMPTPDAELLRRYAERQDQAAFAELVRQHLPLVYRCACRSLGGDTTRAQDVAQEVFVDLARKAPALASHPALAAWLHTATHYTAAEMRRGEQRRQQRHEEARNMHEIENSGPSEPRWDRLQPVVDDALASLKEADREAVLLRFFAEKSHAEIGLRLGLGEDAARMRVERALEKLRAQLVRRGIVSTGAALGAALAGQGALAVPAGLATSIAQAAVSATGAVAGAGFFAWLATGGGKAVAVTSFAAAAAVGVVVLSRLAGSESPPSVSTTSARPETPDDRWSALVERWDFGSEAERGFLLRAFEAGELGTRLLGLWRANDSVSHARFWSIFEHWCAAAPEAAAKWSAGTWDEITGADGVKLREQAGFAWVKRSPRPAFEWARALRDAEEETGLAARMLRQLAHTDSGEAIALAKDVSDKFYETARFGILEGWFTHDRAAAIERLGDECVRHHRMPKLLAGWAQADLHAFMSWGLDGTWSHISDKSLRDQLLLRHQASRDGISLLPDLGEFVPMVFAEYLETPPAGLPVRAIDEARLVCAFNFTHWRDRNPSAAHEWLLSLPTEAESTQEFIRQWGGSYTGSPDGKRNHAAQIQTLLLLPESPARTKSLKDQIRYWTGHDLEGALAWVRATGDASLHGFAYEGAILGLAPGSPDQAAALYSSLPDTPAKASVAFELSAAWAAADPEAALRWLDQAQPAWPRTALEENDEHSGKFLGAWATSRPADYVTWLLSHAVDDTQGIQNILRMSRSHMKLAGAAKLGAAYRARKSWIEIKPAALAWLRLSEADAVGYILMSDMFTEEERSLLLSEARKGK